MILTSQILAAAAVLTFPKAPFNMPALRMHDFPLNKFCITDYGARTGVAFKVTRSIERAIFACSEAGGGRVIIPPGWYLTGAIHLKSGVELHLEPGAVLEFTDEPKDYLPAVRVSWEGVECLGYSPLIYAYGCTNIAITGSGMLRARTALWTRWAEELKPSSRELGRKMEEWGRDGVPVEDRNLTAYPNGGKRPHGIEFNRCQNIRLEGFKVREMPFWTIHLFHSADILCRGLDIVNHIANSDGIDIDSTKNVLIENCMLDQGDDGFVMKSGRDHDGRRLACPTENVIIRNCKIRFAHVLLGCGSELSGGIRNVFLHDCELTDCYRGFYVKTNPNRGGFVENVWFKNVHARSCAQLVAIRCTYGMRTDGDVHLTKISGIHVEDVCCQTADVGIQLLGDARLPARDVSLKNVHVGAVSTALKKIENVEGLHEENVTLGDGIARMSDNPESRRIIFWGDAVHEDLPARERQKVDRGVYVFDYSRGVGSWEEAAAALRPRDCLYVKVTKAAAADQLLRSARDCAVWVLDDIKQVPRDFYREEFRK